MRLVNNVAQNDRPYDSIHPHRHPANILLDETGKPQTSDGLSHLDDLSLGDRMRLYRRIPSSRTYKTLIPWLEVGLVNTHPLLPTYINLID